jgi:hypothetical protein
MSFLYSFYYLLISYKIQLIVLIIKPKSIQEISIQNELKASSNSVTGLLVATFIIVLNDQ